MRKKAATFDETRKLLEWNKAHGVKVTRKPGLMQRFLEKLKGTGAGGSNYNPFTNKIYISKNHPDEKKLGISRRNALAHETGHAIHIQKGPSAFKRIYDNFKMIKRKDMDTFNGKILKKERIANSNALNFLKDKDSKESYKKEITDAAKTYSQKYKIGRSVGGKVYKKMKDKKSLESILKKKPYER